MVARDLEPFVLKLLFLTFLDIGLYLLPIVVGVQSFINFTELLTCRLTMAVGCWMMRRRPVDVLGLLAFYSSFTISSSSINMNYSSTSATLFSLMIKFLTGLALGVIIPTEK